MNSVPGFPEFAQLQLHHDPLIKDITHQFPAYSDFNFISLFSWDTDAAIGVSMLHNNLVVRFSDYEDGTIFLSFIGTHRLADTLDILFAYCRQQHLPHELRLVPHTVVKALLNDRETAEKYSIAESRDNHDYVLSVKNISELGPDFKRKRKAVNRFVSRYGATTWHGELDLKSQDVLASIREVMNDWKHSRHRQDDEDKKEFVAINRTLTHAEQLGARAYGVRVDNKLIAFTLFELTPQNMAVFHFTKADVAYEGIFEFLKHSLAKFLHTHHVEFINIEQDLGVEGMRIAKESYRPVHYLQKYVISLKEK